MTPSSLDILRLGATSGKTVMLNFYSATPSTTKEYTPSGSLEPMHIHLDNGRKLEYPEREREKEMDGWSL